MKTYKIIPIIIFLFALSFTTTAQNHRTLKGKIINNETKTPVSFAIVALYNQETSSIIDGAVCNNKGEFEISIKQDQDYYLEISHVAYETKKVSKKDLSMNDSDLNAGNLTINSKEIQLSKVLIKGERPVVTEKNDTEEPIN